MTFLIADDSQGKIDLLRPLVERAGFSDIVIAYSTDEAMRIIDKQKIDAAFIDYNFPTRNGPSVMRYLHKANPAARIACTSSGNPVLFSGDAMNAGAEQFICTANTADKVEQEVLDILAEWQAGA